MVDAISACESRDMHLVRKRATRFRRGQFWATLSVFALCAASLNSGCAAEVNTLEPLDESAAGEGNVDMPAAAGTKATTGGQASSGGSVSGSAGTKTVSAFGGTSSSGGKTGTGGGGGTSASAGAGGKGGAGGSGGTNSGGAKNGGAGGQGGAGGNASGGSASGGSASGGMAGAGGGLACLAKWKGDVCDTCSKQTQSDKLACVDILDCYVANSCGPASCGGNTDKCGANKIGKGTAGYPIAQDVYTCLCK